ncbi:MAG: GerAB/ArcD/ProY family transporter [Bacilli bacterium]|nr:GerAB/ArcD/ProY family transporter [Bacilli bacterium]
MKKISNLEFGSLFIVLIITINSGINKELLLNNTGINTWFTLTLSYILGLIPILLFLYISNYLEKNTLNEKIKCLYQKGHILINIILFIIFFILGFTLLYNISKIVTSQFLYRTPAFFCSLLLMIVVSHAANKGINTITRLSLILLTINLLLYFISYSSLIESFDIENLKPFLKEDTDKIFKTALLVCSDVVLPILILLVIPKNQIDHKNKYNQTVIISYIIGCIISISIIAFSMGILGIYLTKLFEHPEYMILKKVKLFGFLERIENIVYNQWVFGNFIYLSLIVYYLKTTIKIKENKQKYITYIISTLMLVFSTYIFKNNTQFDNYISNILPYILAIILPIYILITIKIYINNNKGKLCK